MDDVSVLQASGLFADLAGEQLECLRPALRRRTYATGAYVWHLGDPTGFAVIVVSGLIKAYRTGSGGREFVMSIKGPLETMGDYHLFEQDTRRVYDCVALQRTECLVVARDLLNYRLEHEPRLTRVLARSLLRKLREESEAAVDMPAAGSIDRRLAHRLLQLADRHGEMVDGGVRIPFALPQSLLAGMVGASREHVNRALGRLGAQGLLTRDPAGVLTLRRPDSLRRRLE